MLLCTHQSRALPLASPVPYINNMHETMGVYVRRAGEEIRQMRGVSTLKVNDQKI